MLPKSPRFHPGDKVRVKSGTMNPEYDDIPIGGWSGTIRDVEQTQAQVTYEIQWDQRTLDSMHPVYLKRCVRDDLDVKTFWLDETDLAEDEGTPVASEKPLRIKTPPLSETNQDDRVRKVFGLTHDDPIPEISPSSLKAYHHYLTEHLKFPFTAFCGEETVGPHSKKRPTLTVNGLIDPEEVETDPEEGLYCACEDENGEIDQPLYEIEVKKKDPNFKFLSDYAYWFHNWPCQFEDDPDLDPFGENDFSNARVTVWEALIAFGFFILLGGLIGGAIGATFKTNPSAGTALTAGGTVVGLIAAMTAGWSRWKAEPPGKKLRKCVSSFLISLVLGGLIGMVLGILVLTLPWSLAGVLIEFFVKAFLPGKHLRLPTPRAGTLGACAGVVFSAFRQNQTQAYAGLVSGVLFGAVGVAGLAAVMLAGTYLVGFVLRAFEKKA